MSIIKHISAALFLAALVSAAPTFLDEDAIVPEGEETGFYAAYSVAESNQQGCYSVGSTLTVNLPHGGAGVLKLTLATPCTVVKECTDIPACKDKLEIGGGSCPGAQIKITEPGWAYTNNKAIRTLLNLGAGCMPCPGAKIKADPNADAIACVIAGKAFNPMIKGLHKGVDVVAHAGVVTGEAFESLGKDIGDGTVTAAEKVAAVTEIIGKGTAGVASDIADEIAKVVATVTDSIGHMGINIGSVMKDGIFDIGDAIKSVFR